MDDWRSDPGKHHAPFTSEKPQPLIAVYEVKAIETLRSRYEAAFRARYKTSPPRLDTDLNYLGQVYRAIGSGDVSDLIAHYLWMNDPWFEKKGHDLHTLITNLTRIKADWGMNGKKTPTDNMGMMSEVEKCRFYLFELPSPGSFEQANLRPFGKGRFTIGETDTLFTEKEFYEVVEKVKASPELDGNPPTATEVLKGVIEHAKAVLGDGFKPMNAPRPMRALAPK